MTLEPLSTTNVVTIVGWIIAFAFGLLSAVIVQRRGKARKVISWNVVSESNILARDALQQLESGFGVPVRVIVDGHEETTLSTIRVLITSVSNVEVENLTLYFGFGPTASVYVGRYVGDLGAYRQKLRLIKSDNVAELAVAHINPGQSVEVEFLVGRYESGHFTVDLAEPGVTLRLARALILETPEQRLDRLRLVSLVFAALLAFLMGVFALLLYRLGNDARSADHVAAPRDNVGLPPPNSR